MFCCSTSRYYLSYSGESLLVLLKNSNVRREPCQPLDSVQEGSPSHPHPFFTRSSTLHPNNGSCKLHNTSMYTPQHIHVYSHHKRCRCPRCCATLSPYGTLRHIRPYTPASYGTCPSSTWHTSLPPMLPPHTLARHPSWQTCCVPQVKDRPEVWVHGVST